MNMCDKQQSSLSLLLLAVCCAVLLQTVQTQENTTTQVTESSEPYLLVATSSKILRMNMDGTNVTTLVTDIDRIIAMDYHYRLNLIFWTTKFSPDIKRASLTDGSNVTDLQIRKIDVPVGLAVDWMNDKVYWSDKQLKAIYSYDLDTGVTSKVVTLNTESIPSKLKIYPQANDEGWLFIGDLSREGIYKISLDDKEEVKVVTSMCPNNLAMDYSNGNLFWVDSCTYQLGTSKIDGSQDHIVQTGSNSFFSYGASVYDTHVFWIEAGETSSVDCFEMVTSEQHRVYTTTGTITRDIQIVHSSNQPSLAILVLLEICQESCVNGRCGENALCICEEGWTGSECASVLSGTSAPQTTPTTIAQTTPTTAAQTTPTTTAQTTPTTAAQTTPTTAAQTTPTTEAQTTPTTEAQTTSTTVAQTTTAAQTTTETQPPTATDTSSSTSLPSTTSSVSSTTQTSSSTFTGSDTTDDQEITNIPSGQQATTNSAGSSDNSVVPDTTTASVNQGLTEDGGLQVNGSRDVALIMIAIFPAVGLVILVIAIVYSIFLYRKCKNRKMGIYNVHERHQEYTPPGRLDSTTAEFGTESVRGSFRDVTERYHQERILHREIERICSTSTQGCAEHEEVGCAAEMARADEMTPRGCAVTEMDCVIVETTPQGCAVTEMDCAVEMPCAVEMTPPGPGPREVVTQSCALNISSPCHSLSPSTASTSSEASSSCGLLSVHDTSK